MSGLEEEVKFVFETGPNSELGGSGDSFSGRCCTQEGFGQPDSVASH